MAHKPLSTITIQQLIHGQLTTWGVCSEQFKPQNIQMYI